MSTVRPTIILFQGKPATGKSTIAKSLAGRLGYPYVSKDEIKETLYSQLEYTADFTVADSRRLGIESFDILYKLLESLLVSGVHVVVEAAWYTEFAAPRLAQLIQEYNVDVVQVVCSTKESVRKERFAKRARSIRHAVHMDSGRANDCAEDAHAAIDIPSQLVQLDTTTGTIEEHLQTILKQLKNSA